MVTKSYAIGAIEGKYTQGVFKDFKTAINQTARAGEYLWRLEDKGSGPVTAHKIRRWNQQEGEWVKLQDEIEPTDELSQFHHNLRKPVESEKPDLSKSQFHRPPPQRKSVTMELREEAKPQTEYTNDVDLAYFERGLKFSKNALDDALLEQPSLLQQASDRYAIALSRRDLAKDEIKQLEGRLYVQIRHELEGKGEKPTEALLAARINSHPARIEAVQKYSKAVEECGRWEGIKDGYKDRGYAIKVMADLHAAGYWSNNSAQGADYRQKNADYDQNQEIRRNAYRNRQGNVR